MKRRGALIAAAGATLLPLSLFAAAPERMVRVGWMDIGTASTNEAWLVSFKKYMRDLGYVEGRNLTVIVRRPDANAASLQAIARELTALNPDVIVATSIAGIHALQKAGKVIPVVMLFVTDPVAAGFAASLAHPGGNVTGPSSGVGHELFSKRVELLRIVLPSLARIGVLTADNSEHEGQVKSISAAANPLGIQVITAMARNGDEIGRATASLARQGANALMVLGGFPHATLREQFAQAALRNKLALMSPHRAYVEAGALLSFGSSPQAQFETAARYVDRILNGAKAGNLPIEQPARVEMVINKKTANALGIALPQQLLLRADEVIE